MRNIAAFPSLVSGSALRELQHGESSVGQVDPVQQQLDKLQVVGHFAAAAQATLQKDPWQFVVHVSDVPLYGLPE